MLRYVIQYHSQTAAVLANKDEIQSTQLPKWRFALPDGYMALSDMTKRAGDINLYNGLDIIMQVQADSQEKAIEQSTNHCETVLNLITFSTLAFCHQGRLTSIITFDQQNTPNLRYYLYPFIQESITDSPIRINGDIFEEIHKAYYAQSDIDTQRRLMRALSWLRKGINEENTMDEFISYWVGLEVIKCRLRRWLKKNGVEKNPQEWDGLKYVFENKVGYTGFEQIKDARHGLLHGFRELNPDFVGEINGYIEPIRKALIESTALILGLNANTIDSIASMDVRRASKQWHVIEGDIEGLPNDFDKLTLNYPRIDIERPDLQSYEFDSEGKLNIKGTYSTHMNIPNGQWHLKATEVWGRVSPGIEHNPLSIKRHDQK